MRSYDYGHRTGVLPLSWDEVASIAARVTEALQTERVDMVVGVARAGLVPAAMVAAGLRCEFCPVRVTRRVDDQVRHASPVWKSPVPGDVKGRRVAVVDEIADTGATLRIVSAEVEARGASHVVTACLVSHSWASPAPTVSGVVTDALVVFPWDRWVLIDGEWRLHPELEDALKLQGLDEKLP